MVVPHKLLFVSFRNGVQAPNGLQQLFLVKAIDILEVEEAARLKHFIHLLHDFVLIIVHVNSRQINHVLLLDHSLWVHLPLG